MRPVITVRKLAAAACAVLALGVVTAVPTASAASNGWMLTVARSAQYNVESIPALGWKIGIGHGAKCNYLNRRIYWCTVKAHGIKGYRVITRPTRCVYTGFTVALGVLELPRFR